MKPIAERAAVVLAGVTVACLLTVAHASNFGFLDSAPASNFDETDWKLLGQAVNDLLEKGADGDTGAWKNEGNGHHGSLVLIKTYDAYGTTCRQLRITNEAGDFRATSLRDMCKDKEGVWKILK